MHEAGPATAVVGEDEVGRNKGFAPMDGGSSERPLEYATNLSGRKADDDVESELGRLGFEHDTPRVSRQNSLVDGAVGGSLLLWSSVGNGEEFEAREERLGNGGYVVGGGGPDDVGGVNGDSGEFVDEFSGGVAFEKAIEISVGGEIFGTSDFIDLVENEERVRAGSENDGVEYETVLGPLPLSVSASDDPACGEGVHGDEFMVDAENLG